MPVTHDLGLQDSNHIVVRVEAPSLGSKQWAETRLTLTDGAAALTVQDVVLPGLNGVFARPRDSSSKPLPTILLLHGSEGGSKESAHATAIRFANLGYAAFALNYFAWPAASLTGVPQTFIDIPVEGLADRTQLAYETARCRGRPRGGVGSIQGSRVLACRSRALPLDRPCGGLRSKQCCLVWFRQTAKSR